MKPASKTIYVYQLPGEKGKQGGKERLTYFHKIASQKHVFHRKKEKQISN